MIRQFDNADFILNVSKAGDLFSNDVKKIKKEYKYMMKIWHPDINTDKKASVVFHKINILYQEALELMKNQKWEKISFLQLQAIDGKMIQINFLTCDSFELGKLYVCNEKVIYLFDKDKKIYYQNMIRKINRLVFFDRQMEKEIKRFLPEIIENCQLKSGEFYVAVKKAENVFYLFDIIQYYEGKIDDRHVAWIMSRLLNLACYFELTGIVHNGMSLKNCFISPQDHSLFLYGGFWYTSEKKEKMIGVSKEIFDVMPLSTKSTGYSTSMTDLEAIKLIGRTLLEKSENIPLPFQKWLDSGSKNSAIEEMKKWDSTILKSYGERKFVKMDISKEVLYSKINIKLS